MRCPAQFVVFLTLAACGAAPVDVRDRDRGRSDSAVATALARPIMVDARLRGDANRDALAPPERPMQAILPPGEDDAGPPTSSATLMARSAARATRTGGVFAQCDWQVRYSYGWAARLASDLPLPDDARTLEAAGSERPACALRIVRFATGSTPDRALARYRDLATRRGFAVRDLGGEPMGILAVRQRDSAAFVGVASDRPGGAIVEMLANRGG